MPCSGDDDGPMRCATLVGPAHPLGEHRPRVFGGRDGLTDPRGQRPRLRAIPSVAGPTGVDPHLVVHQRTPHAVPAGWQVRRAGCVSP